MFDDMSFLLQQGGGGFHHRKMEMRITATTTTTIPKMIHFHRPKGWGREEGDAGHTYHTAAGGENTIEEKKEEKRNSRAQGWEGGYKRN